MSIIFFTVGELGQSGEVPRKNKLVVSDNLAALTTAGYLNASNTGGKQIFPTDVFDVLYSYTPTSGFQSASAFGTGTYIVCTVTVGAGNVITLVPWVSSGDVLLPVVSGNIASFNGTSGQIADSGVSATSPVFLGNVQSGIPTTSSAGGIFTAYPHVGSSGSLILAALTNTGGNFSTTIVNSTNYGQNQAITIPNAGGPTANFSLAPAALVSGNLISASGTAGLIQNSGISSTSVSSAITQLGTINQVSVTLTPAQMVTAYDTPLTLIATPGATKMIQIISVAVYTASTGNTAYATGTAPIIQYGTTAHGAGTLATGAGLVAGDITAATSQVRTLGPAASSAFTGTSNLPITFSNATGDYSGGTGTNIVITLVYQVLTATV